MRKLIAVAAAAALVWRFLSRRRETVAPRVVIGYGDGTTVTLEPGSPGRERLVDAAKDALHA